MLGNDFYKYKNFSNRKFVNEIIAWNFGESGILKVGKIHHNRKGEKEMPSEYKILDEIEYSIELFRWNRTSKVW